MQVLQKTSRAKTILYGARLHGMDAADTRQRIGEILKRWGGDRARAARWKSCPRTSAVAIRPRVLSQSARAAARRANARARPASMRGAGIVRELREKSGTTILLDHARHGSRPRGCATASPSWTRQGRRARTRRRPARADAARTGTARRWRMCVLHLTGRSLAEDEEARRPPSQCG